MEALAFAGALKTEGALVVHDQICFVTLVPTSAT